MEIANRFGNNEMNSGDPDDSSSPEKDKKKDRRTDKKPIVLEGILFDRSRDLKETEKTDKEAKKPAVESEATEIEAAAKSTEVLAAEREVAEEIVQDRAQTVASEIAAEPIGPEATVAQADENLLQEIRDRIDTVQAAGPSNTEAVTETINTAYRQAAEELSSQPPETIPEPELVPVAETAAPDAIDAALRSMNEAYEHYQVPDYARQPETIPEPEPESQASALPQAPAENRPDYSRTATREQVVAVGILGYWWGRWRGRKRAERRFAPIKRNLEKTVTELQDAVGDREAQIRDLQREQLKQTPATETLETVETKPSPVLAETLPPAAVSHEAQPTANVVGETMTMPLPATPEAGNEVLEHAPRAEQLTSTQLLQVAEAIKIDGVTVRSMFEVQRFDESSLRRIVNEYLRHGDVSRVVAEEVERHDRFRYARFETLNQAAPGPMISSTPMTNSHDSLPRPIFPAANTAFMKTRRSNNHTGATKSLSSGTQMTVVGPTMAERFMIALSILFVGIALVLLVAIITSRS